MIKIKNIVEFVFVSVLGVFLHYSYALSGYNHLAGYFSAVNESVWEHLKLVFWPFFVWSIIDYFLYGNKINDFWAAKITSVIFSMLFIISSFYVYTGVLGFNVLPVDILLFFLAVISGICVNNHLIYDESDVNRYDNIRGFIYFIMLGACFVMWTYNAPDLGLFMG